MGYAITIEDVETTRMLILTGLAAPPHVSASGKSATDYADEREIKSNQMIKLCGKNSVLYSCCK